MANLGTARVWLVSGSLVASVALTGCGHGEDGFKVIDSNIVVREVPTPDPVTSPTSEAMPSASPDRSASPSLSATPTPEPNLETPANPPLVVETKPKPATTSVAPVPGPDKASQSRASVVTPVSPVTAVSPVSTVTPASVVTVVTISAKSAD